MKRTKKNSDETGSPGKKADMLLMKDNPEINQQLAGKDKKLLFQEPEVQKVDLTNEMLLKKYTLLYDFAQIGYFILTPECIISEINIPVLVLSALPEEYYALKVMEAGASGFLNKIAASDKLIFAIREIVSGRKYMKSFMRNKMNSIRKKENSSSLQNKLTSREFEIMILIASGKTIKEIANRLFLSAPTIYVYRSKILKKLKMKNDKEIIQHCVKKGLI